MKVLAFAASNSSTSINKQLITHAADVLTSGITPDANVEIIDLNDYEMPIYSSDREKAGGVPDAAKQFFDKIGAADALLISFAEHNGTYTAAYKNIYDWASRIDAKVYQGKPAVVLSASPGQTGGASVMQSIKMAAPYYGLEIKGDLSVGSFYDVFKDGKLADADVAAKLHEALSAL